MEIKAMIYKTSFKTALKCSLEKQNKNKQKQTKNNTL